MPEAEVLVAGGGIAGASTAYHLALYGVDVALLERGDIASEASGVNAGSIGGLGWGDTPDLEAHLTMGSIELFKEMQLDLGLDIEFRQSGSLQAVHTEEHYPVRAQAEPLKATRAFAAVAERNGARTLTDHEVTGMVGLGDDTYRVETTQGEFRAGTLVIAAGAWSASIGAMLGVRLPVVPVRGQMWATEPVPPRLFQTISSAESAFHWHRDSGRDANTPPALTHRGDARVTRHLYGRQTRGGEVIFGGDRQVVGFNRCPDPAGIEVNRAHAAEVLPFVATLPVKRTWAGLMPFTLDGEPIIGKVPGVPNVFACTGLGSSGFGRGPMAGKLLADYVHTGNLPDVLAESDPARYVTPSP